MDEDALICDFAETYHVLNYRSLPLRLVATLSAGLRDDSRIVMKVTGSKISIDTMLKAGAYDKLANLLWINSQDGADGINRPESVLNILMGKKNERPVTGYNTPEDFERRRLEILKGGS